MAGLLKPYVAETLVTRLKETCSVPIAMQSHATTGMSTSTILKAAEAGIDMVDTAISSMSMTYGHSPTESVVAILEDTDRSTGLNLRLLEEIAAYFREVRKKYAKFEGALKGVDSRILVAQVPGGMLTNMENQLREQGATDRLDAVLAEIPRVREELGFLPLVTPTSQIVGSQAVLNVLMGERYKSITNETAGVLKGEYGATPAPVSVALQQRVLAEGEAPITCRPADHLTPEARCAHRGAATPGRGALSEACLGRRGRCADLCPVSSGRAQVHRESRKSERLRASALAGASRPEGRRDRARPTAPAPSAAVAERYRVEVDGHSYRVVVSPDGAVEQLTAVSGPAVPAAPAAGRAVPAPLAGTVVAVKVKPGQRIASGELILLLEAMKMETEVRSPEAGTVLALSVKDGDSLRVGQTMLTLG